MAKIKIAIKIIEEKFAKNFAKKSPQEIYDELLQIDLNTLTEMELEAYKFLLFYTLQNLPEK